MSSVWRVDFPYAENHHALPFLSALWPHKGPLELENDKPRSLWQFVTQQ